VSLGIIGVTAMCTILGTLADLPELINRATPYR